MLKITTPQIRGMLEGDAGMLLAALERLVRAEHGAVIAGVPDDLVQRMLQTAVDAAHGFGFVQASDVAAFTLLMVEFGPGFHKHPVVRDVLVDRSLPPERRLAVVCHDTPAAVWRDIEAHLHQHTWFPASAAR